MFPKASVLSCLILLGCFAASLGMTSINQLLVDGLRKFENSGGASKVIGGTAAEEGSFPYIASVQLGSYHLCGGTIISDTWIVTAAQCLILPVDRVVVGITKLSENGVAYSVDKRILHEKFNLLTVENLIGLVQTSTPIHFSNKVSPVPVSNFFVGNGNEVTAYGWGRSEYFPDNNTDDLQYITLRTIDKSECIIPDGSFEVQDSNICTFTKDEAAICVGDWGGPLVGNGTLVGVTSFGDCANEYPGLFTRISYYIDWIKERTGLEI